MHVGDVDGTVAMVDTDDQAADAGMRVDLGGLEDVVKGFFAAASHPHHCHSTRLPQGWRCRCLRRRQWSAWGLWCLCQHRRR